MTQATSFTAQEENPGQQTPGQGGETNPSFSDKGGDGGAPQLSEEQIQEILKRDEHAQKHIQTLEQEAKDRAQKIQELEERYQRIEADLEKRESFESALEKLQQQQAAGQSTKEDQTTVDPNDIAAQVLKRIESENQAKTHEANRAKAVEAARQKFGEQYLDQVSARAEQLGMSLNDVDDLAATRPQVYNELFIGKGGKEPPTKPSVSGQRAAHVPEGGEEEQRELYRQNRKEFYGKANFDRIREQLNK